jgi:hypothetical protein
LIGFALKRTPWRSGTIAVAWRCNDVSEQTAPRFPLKRLSTSVILLVFQRPSLDPPVTQHGSTRQDQGQGVLPLLRPRSLCSPLYTPFIRRYPSVQKAARSQPRRVVRAGTVLQQRRVPECGAAQGKRSGYRQGTGREGDTGTTLGQLDHG